MEKELPGKFYEASLPSALVNLKKAGFSAQEIVKNISEIVVADPYRAYDILENFPSIEKSEYDHFGLTPSRMAALEDNLNGDFRKSYAYRELYTNKTLALMIEDRAELQRAGHSHKSIGALLGNIFAGFATERGQEADRWMRWDSADFERFKIKINGNIYIVDRSSLRQTIGCPWPSCTSGEKPVKQDEYKLQRRYLYKITNSETGKTLKMRGLHAHLIAEHQFFLNTRAREIIEFFGLAGKNEIQMEFVRSLREIEAYRDYVEKLKRFNLTPEIAFIYECQMRPKELSTEGFLEWNQRLIDTLLKDEATMRRAGISYKAIGDILYVLADAHGRIEINRTTYKVEHPPDICGSQACFCPHGDYPSGWNIRVTNTETNESHIFSRLLAHLIREHFFFNGEGIPHRVAPETFIKFFNLKPGEEPVIQKP